MNRIEILAIVTPIFVVASVILTIWIANYFEDKKAAAERLAAPSSRGDKPSAASAAE